jgi:hypothetical protein
VSLIESISKFSKVLAFLGGGKCFFIVKFLEFAVLVWCPFLKGDIDMIEHVQQRATKLIRNLSYENRLRKLELTTFKDRRLRGDSNV